MYLIYRLASLLGFCIQPKQNRKKKKARIRLKDEKSKLFHICQAFSVILSPEITAGNATTT